MTSFDSLAAFVVAIPGMEAKVHAQFEKGMKKVALKVEQTAKNQIGAYQKAIGPYPEWEELADVTRADRLRKGYTEDDPLLRSGELRDSIRHTVRGLEAEIGSDSDIAVYQELGTEDIPPRPFLGPAVDHNHNAIKKILGGAVVKGLLNGGSIPSHPEYDYEV